MVSVRVVRWGHAGDRMLLGLEQLSVCRELLVSDSPVKARMAVILLDGLADSIIYRRLQDLYAMSEQRFAPDGPRAYSKKERRQARMNFEQRVELAQDELPEGGLVWDEGPVLDGLDAVVVLVGHSYRKDAHHYDTHNPAVIGPIGRVMFAAIARMFTRSQPQGVYVGYSQAMLDELATYGVDRVGHRVVTTRDLAAQGAAKMLVGLEIDVATLGEALAVDLETRAEQAGGDVDFLPLNGDDLNSVLGSYELWSKHSADEDIIELRNRADLVTRIYREHLDVVPASYRREAEAAAFALRDWMAEIERSERPSGTLDLIDVARGAAVRLRAETDLAALLTEYHDVDRRLRVLEESLNAAVEDYDRAVQHEIDLRRGK